MPPRASSCCCRSRPTARSSCSTSPAVPSSSAACAPSYDIRSRERTSARSTVTFGRSTRLVEGDRPEQCRTGLVRQEGSGTFRERRRVERDPAAGAVQRHPAGVGFQVDRVAGLDEGRDVGDRVVDHEAGPVALDVERLVEVHRSLGVDGEQLDVRAVELGQPRRGPGLLGGPQHLGRKLAGSSSSCSTCASASRRASELSLTRTTMLGMPRP